MHYKSIFISDTHLGSITSCADILGDFLKHNSADAIFIVGDFIDFWALSRKPYFPQSHIDVIRKLLKKSKHGTRIVWICGNHDMIVRDLIPLAFDNIEVVNEAVYESINGKKFLVIHGDQFDQIMKYAKWLAWLGDVGYTLLLRANGFINKMRRYFGCGYWSLSAYIKGHVKEAVNFISNYEDAIVHRVETLHYDGVICGHIHKAEMRIIGKILYMNCGDWCESLSAIVEDKDGEFRLVHWHGEHII